MLAIASLELITQVLRVGLALFGCWIEVRVRPCGEWVVNWSGPIGEVAPALLYGRNRDGRPAGAAGDTEKFNVSEEERADPAAMVDFRNDYRAADEAAELVLVVFGPLIAGFAVGRELRGVQAFVAQIFKGATVELAASGLRRGNNLAAGGRPVFRFVSGSQHAELADHVWGHAEVRKGHHAALCHAAFLHADAIHNGFITGGQPAIDASIERAITTA